MHKIKELQMMMTQNLMMITNTSNIDYFIDHKYDVGERFIALLVPKDGEATLLLNTLFQSPNNIHTHPITDTTNLTSLLSDFIKGEDLMVDGQCELRFVLDLINKGIKLHNASPILERMRSLKSDEEIAILKEASLRNDAIMKHLIEHIHLEVSEIELANIAVKLQSEEPQTGPSFDPIVVFSENAADPHGIPSSRTLKKGDTILIDMGGMYHKYASDMTRVYFTDPNSKLKELYDIVLEANKLAIAAVKLGSSLAAVDKAARDHITQMGYGAYFTHRTGHGIGRECHETLDVSGSNETIIENGMCFSIEPGIYIEGFGGIRIEDIVCMHKGEVHVLNQAPKEFSDICLHIEE